MYSPHRPEETRAGAWPRPAPPSSLSTSSTAGRTRARTDDRQPRGSGLRVGIVGCGLIGRQAGRGPRAPTTSSGLLRHRSRSRRSARRASGAAGPAAPSSELLELAPDVVVVATVHGELAELACSALAAGAHVLVEKPAGIGVAEVDRDRRRRARKPGRRVKVGFNHRFHPGIARAISEARSGVYGEVLYLAGALRPRRSPRLRARSGEPTRRCSGGGEIVDQGMHLLDLSYWLLGELPLDTLSLRTQFWQAPVDDNAVLVLGGAGRRRRSRRPVRPAARQLDRVEEHVLPGDRLPRREARRRRPRCAPTAPRSCGSTGCDRSSDPLTSRKCATRTATSRGSASGGTSPTPITAADGRDLLGDLSSARYCWSVVEQALGR